MKGRKGGSIVEIVAVFVFMKFFSIWCDAWLKGMDVHHGWRNLCFGLQAIVIPLAIIWLTKRDWSAYGLGRANFRKIIHFGFLGTMLMLLTGAGFGFLKSQRISPVGLAGSLIMTVIALVMIGILLFAFRKFDKPNAFGNSSRPRLSYKLLILAGMVLCPIIVSSIRGTLSSEIVAWEAYFLFMVGLGEEIKYRGYFQSRINEEYGRPWEFSGVRCGPGLIVTSLLFAVSHMTQFGSFNPFEGNWDVNPWMGVQTFFGSVFFGLIREKTGSVFPSSIAHGVPNAFGQTLAKVFGG